VNDTGQAVGWAGNSLALGSHSGERAFVHNGGTMTQLPVLPGAGYTHAYAINNTGTVVGVSGNNQPYKFSIGDTTLTQLAFPAGSGGGGRAHDVNSAGDIVGFDYTTFPQQRPVFWDNGVTPVGLPLPAGATSAQAHIINDAGVIAGTAFYGVGIGTRGFYYDAAGTPVDMGTLGPGFLTHEVFDINSSRDAIGRAFNNTTFAFAPFLYRDGTLVNLNSLLPAGSGWVLQRPISITDAGEIIGIGTFNGTPSGFRLTPVPEPTALVSLAVTSLAAAIRRRRRVRSRPEEPPLRPARTTGWLVDNRIQPLRHAERATKPTQSNPMQATRKRHFPLENAEIR
jgi:hypothetical protein